MKKILLIQSRLSPHSIAAERAAYERSAGDAQLVCLSSLDESVGWDDPAALLAGTHGVIIGGSADVDLHGGREEDDESRRVAREILVRLTPLITRALAVKTPILGICFGHQLIAETYGGAIVSDAAQRKAGSHRVRLTEHATEDPIFADFPHEFTAQYGHADSVTMLPDGATVLASSPTCRFSVLRYGTHAYTTQFHPELTRDDMLHRLAKGSRYLPEGVEAESIIKESPEASQVIRKFIEKIVA